jgi:hypothetical protein
MDSLQALQDSYRGGTWCGRNAPHEFDELWQRRLALVREIVDVPATKIHDAVFKVTLLTSFLADGELRLGLTHQCVEDCDRALVVEDETERGLKALEPGLWAACERVRKDLAVAPTDGTAIPESCWRELRDAVSRRCARCGSRTITSRSSCARPSRPGRRSARAGNSTGARQR